ncbi:MAG: ABC transporter ATP-binding protein [Pseudomonadota bacterium]|nr:ABC transporter ATP-binding protein [Pseudomonadota bacterium]MDE3038606.1 ABC transporter ATP-binding protein [Pseudomonadota bacterium]
MSNAALSLQNIARVYDQGGRRLSVFSYLDLEVRRGETVALLGPSGSGKSTLLHIAGLLDTPTSGKVMVGGEDVSGASDGVRTYVRRRQIGFVYQFHHLLPEFSALENVMLPQMIAGVPVAPARERAAGLLDSLGLRERKTHRPARLSGGEQQRVAMARALANDPPLLLADEPTGNLDPITAEATFAVLLKRVRERSLAVLVATHNMDLAKRMDRIVRLEGGMLKPA